MRSLAVVLALAAMLVAGCKKEANDNKAKASGEATQGAIAVPSQVLAYVALSNPEKTIDGALALLGRFVTVPLGREVLLDLLLQRANLDRALTDSIDTKGTFWLIGLDDEQVGEKNPAVAVVPIRSKEAFKKALLQRMQEHAREGELVTYRPKPGVVGVAEARLMIAERYVVAASSRKVFDLTRELITRSLLRAKPQHDVVVHVSMANLNQRDGKRVTDELDQAMDRMRGEMKRRGKDTPVIATAEKTIRGFAEILMSTRELRLSLDVSSEGLELSLAGEASSSGRWAEIVKRQRSGRPFGAKLLPRESYLVFTDHGNAEGQKERDGLVQALLGSAAHEGAHREALLAAARKLSAALSGDMTVAVHRPAGGSGGIALSAVAGVRDVASARGAVVALAEALGNWARDEAKTLDELHGKLQTETAAFSKGKVQGAIYHTTVPQSAEDQQSMEQLLGAKLTVGWAIAEDGNDKVALFSAGKDAEQQLERMSAILAKGKEADSLAGNVAFAAATRDRSRVGMLYVSVVDMLRVLQAAGVMELDPFVADLKNVEVRTAPRIDWGVDERRTTLDITLRLPAQHFMRFKPFFEALGKPGVGALPTVQPMPHIP